MSPKFYMVHNAHWSIQSNLFSAAQHLGALSVWEGQGSGHNRERLMIWTSSHDFSWREGQMPSETVLQRIKWTESNLDTRILTSPQLLEHFINCSTPVYAHTVLGYIINLLIEFNNSAQKRNPELDRLQCWNVSPPDDLIWCVHIQYLLFWNIHLVY